jgi:hypothetical protein
MPNKNDSQSIEDIRKINRARAKRFYKKHQKRIREQNLERYHENKRNLQDSEQG